MCSHSFSQRFLAAAILLGGVASPDARAGSETAEPRLSPFQSEATGISSAPAPQWVVLHRPYLQILGPTGMRFAVSDEPILRQPPALPKLRKAPASGVPSSAQAQEARPERTIITTSPERVLPAAPSVFDGNQGTTVLPPPAAPTPVPTPAGAATPPPDTLSGGSDSANDLSTALPYFEAPIPPTPNGARTILEAPAINLEPSLGAPLPPSSTTYEVK